MPWRWPCRRTAACSRSTSIRTGSRSGSAPGARPASPPRSRSASAWRSTSLDQLIADGAAGSFDLIFIDADKKSYDAYYERSLTLARPGGLLLIDNVLWGGLVADPANTDRQTEILRALNAKLRDDERISLALVPIGDGLTLARKR